MKLEEDFESLLLQAIDKAEKVDQMLLDTLADLLDAQAEFYEEAANLHAEEADAYEALEEELKTIDAETDAEKAEGILANQQALLEDIKQKLNELATHEDANKQSQIPEELAKPLAPPLPSPAPTDTYQEQPIQTTTL